MLLFLNVCLYLVLLKYSYYFEYNIYKCKRKIAFFTVIPAIWAIFSSSVRQLWSLHRESNLYPGRKIYDIILQSSPAQTKITTSISSSKMKTTDAGFNTLNFTTGLLETGQTRFFPDRTLCLLTIQLLKLDFPFFLNVQIWIKTWKEF